MTVRPQQPLQVSVVMPCYQRLRSLNRAVRSVLASADSVSGEVEIILVDDCSPIPIEVALRTILDDARVTVLRHTQNRGPAAARNTGIARAKFDLVLFTDDDVVVDRAWIARLARYLRDAPSRVAGVGGRVRAMGTDVYSRYFEYHHILDPFRMEDGRVLYVVTANCGYRRHVLQEVGGFDEGVRSPGGEDPGLAFKVAGAGYELHIVEDAIVHHDFRPGLRDFFRTFHRYGMGCRNQVERHWKGFPSSVMRTETQLATFGGQKIAVAKDSEVESR